MHESRQQLLPNMQFRVHVESDPHDPIEIEMRRADGTLYQVVTEFDREVNYQGTIFSPGQPLVTIAGGMGEQRQTPGLRRLISISQTVLDPGDPANYATRYADPLFVRPDGHTPTNVLLTLTLGDQIVPISAGVTLGRAAGIIGFEDIDPRYGKTQNQLLIDMHVTEAIDKLQYFADDPCYFDPRPINFDIDDLSNGLHPEALPRLTNVVRPSGCGATNPPENCTSSCAPLPPLRATVETPTGISGARFPAFSGAGFHAVDLPDPASPFDMGMFMLNQIALFLSSNGTVLSDHPCLAANDCRTCQGEADCPDMPAPPTLD